MRNLTIPEAGLVANIRIVSGWDEPTMNITGLIL